MGAGAEIVTLPDPTATVCSTATPVVLTTNPTDALRSKPPPAPETEPVSMPAMPPVLVVVAGLPGLVIAPRLNTMSAPDAPEMAGEPLLTEPPEMLTFASAIRVTLPVPDVSRSKAMSPWRLTAPLIVMSTPVAAIRRYGPLGRTSASVDVLPSALVKLTESATATDWVFTCRVRPALTVTGRPTRATSPLSWPA